MRGMLAIGHGVTAALLWFLTIPSTFASGPSADDLPAGLAIGGAVQCNMRLGGHGGFRIDPKFDWSYSDEAPLGPAVIVSGDYSLERHNPVSDQWETIYTYPYGFELQPGSVESRARRLATGNPTPIFDQVRLQQSWKIDSLGASGNVVTVATCNVEPPPAGQEPLTAVTPVAGGPAEEVFVHQADPSPLPEIEVSSSLYCERGGRGAVTVSWGLVASNNGVGGEEGALVSGVLRSLAREAGGEYSLIQEQPFALWLSSRETQAVDGFVNSRGLAAARLEVEWRVNIGSSADPVASVQRILRTTACT